VCGAQDYANHFNLHPYIKLQQSVHKARKTEDGAQWKVVTVPTNEEGHNGDGTTFNLFFYFCKYLYIYLYVQHSGGVVSIGL
jgi:hypothetical protein